VARAVAGESAAKHGPLDRACEHADIGEGCGPVCLKVSPLDRWDHEAWVEGIVQGEVGDAVVEVMTSIEEASEIGRPSVVGGRFRVDRYPGESGNCVTGVSEGCGVVSANSHSRGLATIRVDADAYLAGLDLALLAHHQGQRDTYSRVVAWVESKDAIVRKVRGRILYQIERGTRS